MNEIQPRKPAGTPTGGEFAGKASSAPSSTLAKAKAAFTPDPQLVAAIDAAFTSQAPLPVAPTYVLAIRRPLMATRYETFEGDEGVEVLELEVGSYDDDDLSFEDCSTWVQARLVEAAGIADMQARQAYLAAVRSDLDNDEALLPLVAAVDYADTMPYRRAVAHTPRLSLTPTALRESLCFSGRDAWLEQVTDERLAELSEDLSSDDTIFHAYRNALDALADQAMRADGFEP